MCGKLEYLQNRVKCTAVDQLYATLLLLRSLLMGVFLFLYDVEFSYFVVIYTLNRCGFDS